MKKLLLTFLFLLSVVVSKSQTPYAIWCKGNTTLTFLIANEEYKPGDTYKGETITNVWSGTDITETPITNDYYGHPSSPWAIKTRGPLTNVVFSKSFAQVNPTTLSGWFCGCSKLTSIEGIQYLNTSKVTNMSQMFYDCSGLTSLDVSKFDTSNVTNMSDMFSGCSGLTSLDVSNFDTSKVTSMGYMFYGCSGLTSLDLSNFDTSNVTDIRWMFGDCTGLKTLDLSSFNTKK